MTAGRPARPDDRALPGVLPRWWRWGVVVAFMAFIFAASSLSHVPVPSRVSDKWIHAAVYAVLAALVVWAATGGDLRRVRWSTVLGAVCASVLYGWSDEVHQLFVPNRQYDLRDLAADAVGASFAAGALWAWGILLRGSRQTKGRSC